MKKHLQVINSMRPLFWSLALLLLFFSTNAVGQAFSGTYSFAGTVAVSYTHLDVYKRQV